MSAFIPERYLTPQRLLWTSVVVAIITITLKTLAWLITDSVGLLSDAMESLVNLASAVFALAMVTIASRPADDDHPYGHHKAEYFSSGFEGMLIIVAAMAIIWAGVSRLFEPQPIQEVGWGLALSVVSSVLNGVLAWVMFRSAKLHRSIALQADAKHLVTDVWTSVGVVVGLSVVWLTGWLWLDALVAVGIGLWVLPRTWLLLKESLNILLEGVPDGIDVDAVGKAINAIPGVKSVHDLHIWALTSGKNSLTAHVVYDENAMSAELIDDIKDALADQFKVFHTTLQLETKPCEHTEDGCNFMQDKSGKK